MQARNYCFTLFKEHEGTSIAHDELSKRIRSSKHVTYCIFQLEECGETKKEHYQGYVEFSSPQRSNAVKRLMGADWVHLEKRRGSSEQCREYCSKTESRIAGPWIWGTISGGRGKRTDLLVIQERIQEGATEKEIADEFFGPWCRYYKAIGRYITLCTLPRTWDTEVFIHWGDSGTGKTRKCYADYDAKDVYPLPRGNNGNVWFDGYTGQSVVLLDDFYGWLPLSLLLKMGDRHPLWVSVKGTMVQFLPRVLYITSNKSWHDWYDWEKYSELKPAWERRITDCKHWTKLV